LGGTDFRTNVSFAFYNPPDSLSDEGIVEVSEVPCDHNVHAVHYSHGNMKGIFRILGRYTSAINDPLSEESGIFVNVEHWEGFNCCESHLGLIWITFSCLFVHDCRDVCIIPGRQVRPKVLGGFLVTGNNDVTAWTSSEVAQNTRFFMC
jgi:hypothetical protein